LVDDHPVFRHGLATVIASAPDLEVVGEAGNFADLRELAAQRELDVASVEVLLPSVGGIVMTRALRELQPTCRVLGLSVVEEPFAVAQMLRAGAVGFALKSESAEQILGALRHTALGERYLAPRISHEAVDHALALDPRGIDASLTKREREIFDFVIRGYTNQEIGSRLFIARRTVETHRHRIAKKLHVHTLVEMQRLAARYRA
jgi:DNA-binding NarL/FixJ family response regulator